MKKESILYGVIGLLTGAIIAAASASYAVNNNNNNMMRMMGMHSKTSNQGMMNNNDMSMSDMTNSLKDKSGDAFDEAFIAEMIIHHQGAIDMANLAKTNAKHDEVKKLADDILTAQSKEINMMQTWQTQWSYKTTPDSESHNMMDMEH